MNRIDETGHRYGKLVVIKQAEKRVADEITWFCKCDCGGEKVVRGRDLRYGKTKSCGCLQHRLKYPKGEAAFNKLWGHYKQNAKKRGHKFSLLKRDFRRLTSYPCYYCGAIPNQVMRPKCSRSGNYIYNGLDRVDNNKGYTLDNAVPCCYICNKAKGSLSQDEFVIWIHKLIKFQSKKHD